MMRVLTVARTSNYPPNHLNPVILLLPHPTESQGSKVSSSLGFEIELNDLFQVVFLACKKHTFHALKQKRHIQILNSRRTCVTYCYF